MVIFSSSIDYRKLKHNCLKDPVLCPFFTDIVKVLIKCIVFVVYDKPFMNDILLIDRTQNTVVQSIEHILWSYS